MSDSVPTAAAAPAAADSSSSSSNGASAASIDEDIDLSSQSLDWWMKQPKKEAGELLLKRAMILAGVSEELGADSARGKALKKEADELMAFANDVQSLPETKQAMEEAHKLMGELNEKYKGVAVQGKGLADESLGLWQSVSKSKEADDLMAQGKTLLSDWMQYGQSDQGKQLLAKGQSMAKGQSGGLISLIDDNLDKEGKPVVQKDQLMNVTQQVSDVGKELHKELADDEDVAELLKLAKRDIASATAIAQDAAHKSILEDKDNPLALQTLSEEQKNTLAIMKGEKVTSSTHSAPHCSTAPLTAVLLLTLTHTLSLLRSFDVGCRQYIRDLKTSGVGQKLLQQGTAYLASGSLSPTAIMGQGASLMNDDKSRHQFINSVKDKALEFLMAYLPTAQVPPVEGEKDGVEYRLSNIDLSGFKVASKDVEVAINEDDGLSIWAINISCLMQGLEFKYKKNTFPKMSGEGKAEAIASGVKFHIRLDLELPDRYKKLVSPLSSKSPSPTSSTSPSAPATPSAGPSAPATPSKKVMIGSNLSKQIASNAAAPPPAAAAAGQTGKPPLSVNTTQQKQQAAAQQQQQQQGGKLFTFPKSNSSTSVAAAVSASSSAVNPLSPNQAPSPRSAYTPGGTPIPQENVIRQQKAVARAVASDTPRLILSKTKVVLPHFQLKITAGDMKWSIIQHAHIRTDTHRPQQYRTASLVHLSGNRASLCRIGSLIRSCCTWCLFAVAAVLL